LGAKPVLLLGFCTKDFENKQKKEELKTYNVPSSGDEEIGIEFALDCRTPLTSVQQSESAKFFNSNDNNQSSLIFSGDINQNIDSPQQKYFKCDIISDFQQTIDNTADYGWFVDIEVSDFDRPESG